MEGKRFDIKWIVITVLAGFLCISIFYQMKPNSVRNKTIIGTYIMETNEMCDARYIVFEEDDKICYYTPFEEKKLGIYKQENEMIFFVMFEHVNKKCIAVLCEGYVYICTDKEVIKFKKLSNIPTYVNAK